jgi:hypothetical protein
MTTWTVRITRNGVDTIIATGVSKQQGDRLIRRHVGAYSMPDRKTEVAR